MDMYIQQGIKDINYTRWTIQQTQSGGEHRTKALGKAAISYNIFKAQVTRLVTLTQPSQAIVALFEQCAPHQSLVISHQPSAISHHISIWTMPDWTAFFTTAFDLGRGEGGKWTIIVLPYFSDSSLLGREGEGRRVTALQGPASSSGQH